MPVLIPSLPLRTRRRLPVTAVNAAIAAAGLAIPTLAGHLVSFPWGWIGGAFVVGFVVDYLVRIVGTDPPEVRWDRECLEVSRNGETDSISWTDFGGYRLTWDWPRGLKVYRPSHWKPVEVDLSAFDDDQRATLLRELTVHPVALPNRRLEPTRRMIKE